MLLSDKRSVRSLSGGQRRVKLLLTITEACQVLAISRSKLYGLLNSGHLPSVHIGRSRRIRITDLEEFVKVGGHAY